MITLSQVLGILGQIALWMLLIIGGIVIGLAGGRFIVWLFQVLFDLW
jgi:hypothetical protein